MLIKAVLFDFNGTLLDDAHVAYGSTREIFLRYSLVPPTREQYLSEVTSNFMDFYRAYGMPATVQPEDLNKIRREYYQLHEPLANFRPDAEHILRLCYDQGLDLGIVSGEIEASLHHRLYKQHLWRYFSCIRADVRGKLSVLQEVAELLRCAPNEAIYIDDTYEGVKSAKDAGLWAIGITGGYGSADQLQAAGADAVVTTLSELEQYIHGFPKTA